MRRQRIKRPASGAGVGRLWATILSTRLGYVARLLGARGHALGAFARGTDDNRGLGWARLGLRAGHRPGLSLGALHRGNRARKEPPRSDGSRREGITFTKREREKVIPPQV